MMVVPYFLRYFGIVLLFIGLAACATPNSITGAGSAKPGSTQDFSVNVGDTVLFTVNSVTLTSSARGTLKRQAAWLKRYPGVTIEVQGHADERGTREYNLGLSAQRAEATRSFLASQGVAANRMRTISFGKERPAATCDAETCWTQNRRSVTVVNNTVS
ncbi:Tol-Pal system peptidoglycan-associated lipoprotein PAL [hydrothermal vent metagenome]|uniref:Tol-Pal system peptidoglycan-associated lipoprotein PAL n=1 Tax=hydrothermal vent metagenome TaxID=652676 RepID=A0A3B0TBT2_9ZZZZ